ncbi:putative protease Do [Trifolium repens]|nr:putative protease Do [Trifolium repens]
MLKEENPWFRENICEQLGEFNPEYYNDNAHLDIHRKKAVLKVSSSVVTLLSYTGEQELTQCSGVIIENDGNNGHIVLTSANLIRRHTEEDLMEDNLAESLKVMIYLYDGGSYKEEVSAYDFHYNIAWIRFQSDSSLTAVKLRQVDDFINVNPSEEKSFHLRPYSCHFNLIPGHAIVSVGRYFAKPFDLMAAPGEFPLDRCDIDCKELFMGTCKTKKCGEGGALINLSGEAIGIIFYYDFGFSTPFMPIDIAQRIKMLGALQKIWATTATFFGSCGYKLLRSYGISHREGYSKNSEYLQWMVFLLRRYCIHIMFLSFNASSNPICVIQGSAADSAGPHLNDVIVRCGKKIVHTFLEFLEMMWDNKVGDVLQLSVVRASQNDLIHVNMVVDDVTVEKFNRSIFCQYCMLINFN